MFPHEIEARCSKRGALLSLRDAICEVSSLPSNLRLLSGSGAAVAPARSILASHPCCSLLPLVAFLGPYSIQPDSCSSSQATCEGMRAHMPTSLPSQKTTQIKERSLPISSERGAAPFVIHHGSHATTGMGFITSLGINGRCMSLLLMAMHLQSWVRSNLDYADGRQGCRQT